jgi:hypothetical protein
MSNSNKFLVGSVALVIWASGVIAPYCFPSVGYAAQPPSVNNVIVTNAPSNPVPVIVQGGPGSSTKTLIELVGPSVPSSVTALYTVPAGQRLILTDIIISCDFVFTVIYRDSTVVSRVSRGNSLVPMHSYQSGIEFREGTAVGIGTPGACTGQSFYELRGYLEPL